MAEPICPSEKVHAHLRKDRLARSTYVSKIVSDYEALSSRSRHEYTAAAGMTPVPAEGLPDADQAMISRSVREIKDELERKTKSTLSQASVKPQKLARTKLLDDGAAKTAGATEPEKLPIIQSQSTAETADTLKLVEPAAGSTQSLDKAVRPDDLLRTLLLGDAAGKATVTAKPEKRARSLADRATRKAAAVKPRKDTHSLTRLDTWSDEPVRPEDLLRTLCLGDTATKATVTVKSEKRARSLADRATRTAAAVKPRTRTRSLSRIDAGSVDTVRPVDLLRTLLLGDASAQATVTVKPRKPVPSQLQSLANAAARATEGTPVLQPPPKPSRFKDYVLHRNKLGHYGFSLLTTLTPDMEPVHVVFQAADSVDTLPVGRLVAVNFSPVENKTTAELHEIFNRSPESVRLRIQQLYFPLSVLQEMVSDQVSPVTYQEHMDYHRQRHIHPAKKWIKRKLRGVASVLSRCRNALTSCWH